MTGTIDVAVVGCGAIAELGHAGALEALADRYRVAMVVDTLAERRDLLGDRFQVPAASRFARVADLLRLGRTDLLAIVAVPTAQLAPVAVTLAEAGLAVLCEKPFATSAAGAHELAGTGVRVIHNYLYRSNIRQAIELTRSGVVGRPRFVRLERPDPGAFPGRGEDPDWRRRSAGGGCLFDNAYHWVYVAEEIAGAPVSRVSAEVARPSGQSADDLAVMTLRHSNGVLTAVQTAWCAVDAEPVLEVHGTDGSVRIGGDAGDCRLIGRTGPLPVAPIAREPSYVAMFRSVSAAVQAGVPFGASVQRCAQVISVIEAAYRAAESGRSTTIDPPRVTELRGMERELCT